MKVKKLKGSNAKNYVEVMDQIGDLMLEGGPENILKEFSKVFKGQQSGELDDQSRLLASQAILMANLDNQAILLHVTVKALRPFLMRFSSDLREEYQCQTASEKAMAQAAAEAYGRVMRLSMDLNNNLSREEYSDLSLLRLKLVGKELDRAERHFLTAIQTLKQLKSPQMNVKVSATNAFISEAQQFNNNQHEKDKQ